jgi:hypothetical protein
MKTLQTLINTINDNLVLKTRPDDTQFYCVADNAPEYVQDLAHHVHDDMMPDDYRYKFLTETIREIADYDEQTLTDMLTGDYDIYDIIGEPDVYNHSLLQWQASNLSRMEYADDCLAEYEPQSLSQLLMSAQHKEMVEVFNLILSWLEQQQYEMWEEVA